jgi:urease accessory protein UreF
MPPQTQKSPEAAVELAADLGLLLEQIGSPDALAGVADALKVRQISTLRELRTFLQGYHTRILRPLELPAIHRAFGHASRREVRELVAFDGQLGGEPLLKTFASSSRLAGQNQLQRLRPLRDERIVQRYLAAVDEGTAQGWHTLVYGLTLAIYSRPLRQGLLGYAQETTRGFIRSASRSIKISREAAQLLFEETCQGLPGAVEPLLGESLLSRS